MSEVFISDNHTKNYLCSIIAHSNIDILQPYILNKQKLMYSLSKFLSEETYDISFYDPTFPFNNKEELIHFLGEDPIKITPGERRMIQDIARKIISFCKSIISIISLTCLACFSGIKIFKSGILFFCSKKYLKLQKVSLIKCLQFESNLP